MNRLKMINGKAQSILCVIDFSESSIHTLKWAVNMASKLGAHLNIIHPYRLNGMKKIEDTVSAKKNLDLEAEKSFGVIAESIFKNRTISYEFHAEVGFITDRLQEHTRKNDLLFIAIGKKLINNVDILPDLIEQIEVPLVIVPENRAKVSA